MTKIQMLIEEANKVIASYTTRLTLRQIYYRLVSKGIIPNKQSQYQYLSKALVRGRISGQISWHDIEDRTRSFDTYGVRYHDPDTYLDSKLRSLKEAPKWYGLPKWYMQPHVVEVWGEKQALEALFSQVTHSVGVTLGICRGYPSITFVHDAATRIADLVDDNVYVEEVTILYFGDHDPSGIDIQRNVIDRLQDTFDVSVVIERIAITPAQIAKYDIPEMPTKKSDARAKKHIAQYGDVSSVELDAIEPNVLQDLIRNACMNYYDEDINNEREAIVEENKAQIQSRLDEILGDFAGEDEDEDA